MAKIKQIRDAKRTRAAILTAATKSFSVNGFKGASISDIADAVGVSKSSIYHHFASKDALLHALIDPFSRDIDLLLAAGATEKLTAKEFLVEYAQILLDHLEVVQLGSMIMAGAPAEVRKVAEAQRDKTVKILVQGTPTNEKLLRAKLALSSLTMTIAPPVRSESSSASRSDVRLLVRIALDILGEP